MHSFKRDSNIDLSSKIIQLPDDMTSYITNFLDLKILIAFSIVSKKIF